MKHAYRWTAPLVLSLLSACGGGSHHGSSAPAAFTIGGSITGLTAGGLVLFDNGGDTLQVTANATSYTFPTQLGTGIGYAATIHTQPTGLSCSIANATGTVASSNVTNVNVTCTALATFTIGGNISGLTASGLVLTNANDGDKVSPAANATSFQFSTHVATGASYNIGVTTQPTGETCSVANPSGTVASSNVTNVNVSCSALATFTIGGSITGLTASGLVLIDNNGDALTVQAYGSTFTFATALVSGATYAVTVKTQAAGETCQVTGGTGTVTANVTTVSVACTTGFTGTTGSSSGGTNVATVVVGPGPADAAHQTFNMPYTSIKVCNTATPQKCAVIDDVEVDTGSSGLRLLASALTSANLTLTPMTDGSSNPIEECYPFGSAAFSWGAVATATVTIGGETTSAPIPVQVIDGTTPPAACGGGGYFQQSSVNDFDANGVLGVGLLPQDCGTGCTTSPPSGGWYYYSCPPSPATCAQTIMPTANQVTNPVIAFTTTADANGVALQLPPVPAGGLATVTGYLVFGIGTQSNNGVGSATILTPDASGSISTQITGLSAVSGFFDSGSNYLAFDDSALATCPPVPPATTSPFYCPSPTPATIQVSNAGNLPFNVSIANINSELTSNPDNFAIGDVGGPLTGFFDWGLPFFYGRTVFTAIQGKNIGGTTYLNGFYAY